MKFSPFILIPLLTIISVSCNVDDIVSEFGNGKITAKEKLGEVMNAAKTGFAQDAQLASIYGREVNTAGEIDLLNTNSFNAFVYVVQSDSLQTNEFYVPVYGFGPVKTPNVFSTILSFIRDTTAKNIIEAALGTLSTVAIDPSAIYSDSPEVLEILLAIHDVKTFRVLNPDSKIDMFLLPSKSINDSLGIANTADWVVNFYSSTSSIVLWRSSSSGIVRNLSDL